MGAEPEAQVITAIFIIGLWIFANVLVLAIALISANEKGKARDKETREQPQREGDKEAVN
jgi:hypothetical protein